MNTFGVVAGDSERAAVTEHAGAAVSDTDSTAVFHRRILNTDHIHRDRPHTDTDA